MVTSKESPASCLTQLKSCNDHSDNDHINEPDIAEGTKFFGIKQTVHFNSVRVCWSVHRVFNV